LAQARGGEWLKISGKAHVRHGPSVTNPTVTVVVLRTCGGSLGGGVANPFLTGETRRGALESPTLYCTDSVPEWGGFNSLSG